MPYRRLPNTDQARLRTLRAAIAEHGKQTDVNELTISYKLINDAKIFLNNFEKTLAQYQQALDSQISANKNYQHIVKNARLYISHFIQVLNLCITRNEIKKEHKSFYKIEPDNFTVPDLSTENSLLEWGKNLIDGEAERMTSLRNTKPAKRCINKIQVDIWILFRECANQATLLFKRSGMK
jgi:hypothetical protein